MAGSLAASSSGHMALCSSMASPTRTRHLPALCSAVPIRSRPLLSTALPIARRQCSAAAAQAGDGGTAPAAPAPLRLVVYTKVDCPLCQGLTGKLRALVDRATFLPSALSGATLEERDIAANPAWAAAYDLSVPVLKAVPAGGAAEVRATAFSLPAQSTGRSVPPAASTLAG